MRNTNKPKADETESPDFDPLTIANDRTRFIEPGDRPGPAILSPQACLKVWPPAVVDAETLKMIEILRLHQAIDQTTSATGSAILLRSLIRPSTDLAYIRSRQDALREIASDDALRQGITDYLVEFAQTESALYKFFNKGLYALSPYSDLKKARQAAVKLPRIIGLHQPESSYLKTLFASLEAYQGSPIDRMMGGSIYQTLGGLKAATEISMFTPRLRLIPRRFSRWVLAGPAAFLAPAIYHKIGFTPPLSPLFATMGAIWTGFYLFYSLFIKPVRDTGKFIEPLRARCVCDNHFNRAINSVGKLDEILALHHFAKALPHAVTLPEVTDQANHCFQAIGIKNPVMASNQTDFTPNDIHLSKVRLTFISGPNSGGKTTICKSIAHNQLLAQIGGYVVAQQAEINIADRISYQAPQFDSLQDDEGRFGSELGRTRDIFYATTPKSLVILDELAEGTTHEERLQTSFGILNDFYTIGNNTVLVTHNHLLADRFKEQEKGQCLMAEFDGEAPTYRIVPGISRVSHAEHIARKINFSSAHRRDYLIKKGYLTI